MNYIYYVDSWGRRRKLLIDKITMGSLRRRKVRHVLPEVEDLIDRMHTATNPLVNVNHVGYELCVHPDSIRKAFSVLVKKGVVRPKNRNEYLITKE